MPTDRYYGEIRSSHQLTLSNLRALEESLCTSQFKDIIPSIDSVTLTSFPDSPAPLPNLQTSPIHHGTSLATPLSNFLHREKNNTFVPYSFPSTEHWEPMTVARWKAILARIRWNLNILIGQEATEALREENPCGVYWKVEARHIKAHDARLVVAQEEYRSEGQDSLSFDPVSTPPSQPPRWQLTTPPKNSGRGREPWYRRLFPFLAATRICEAVNVPHAHDAEEEEEEEEPVRFSIRSRKYWQTEAVFYASHEAKVMLSRGYEEWGYEEFAQNNLPLDATI